MANNNLLTESEEKQIEKKFELIPNCDSNYVIGRLNKNKMLLIDIINICENLMLNYDEMLNDIEHHAKLSKDFYRKPNYEVIKDDYNPILTKRLSKFNKLAKSLNKQNKKIALALDEWLDDNKLTSHYMHYLPFDDETEEGDNCTFNAWEELPHVHVEDGEFFMG